MATRKKKKKVFVLDTNVILHDSDCIYQFEENDVILPICVLEELDQFKKGNQSINFHARAFVRVLDGISGDQIFNGGKVIGPDLGKIVIKLEQPFHDDLALNFNAAKVDHRILNVAYHLKQDSADTEVILVSKDVNLRLKAKSIGLLAQDYRNDHVTDISSIYRGHRIVEDVNEEIIGELYKTPFEIEADRLELNPETDPPLSANEHLVLRQGKNSVLATYDKAQGLIKHVDKQTTFGITPRNAEQTFALDVLLNDDIKLVSLTGKAGTGKTLLALAGALARRRGYRQILMARPVVPLSNKDLGFLPGDIQSKLDPYMQPLFDNLSVLKMASGDTGRDQINKFLEEEKLIISPLAYIRGRSLVKIFFIVDEAQNLTPHEIKTIITRAGEGTKIVFTGDIFQIDHPYLDTMSNGLSYLIERMRGQELYAHINLEKGERSELSEMASNLL